MTRLTGLDLSHWNQGFDLAKADVDFAIVKATDGTTMVDSQCDHFVSQAKSSGKLWGVYCFAYTGSDAEADFFLKNIQGYVGHGVLALDWEANAVKHGPSAAKNWLDRVYAKTGIKPVLYISASVLHSYDWSAVAKAGYGLWLARWGSSSPGDIGPWKTIALWQYTDSRSLQGYRLDGDYFYGDKAAWTAFATSDADHHTDSDTGGDWFDMASKKDLEDAVLAVLKSSEGRKAIANAAWNTDGVISSPGEDKDNPFWTGRGWLGSIRTQAMTKDE